jgi:serine/threonine-protein kinase RsbW
MAGTVSDGTPGNTGSTPSAATGASGRGEVELRLPADSAYASVLRTTTASLAARLDFTIDDIEDLRIAVGEANAMVLEHAGEGADLVATFHLGPGRLTTTVAVQTRQRVVPDLDSFAWQVLSTLATESDLEVADDRFSVTMTMVSSAVTGA